MADEREPLAKAFSRIAKIGEETRATVEDQWVRAIRYAESIQDQSSVPGPPAPTEQEGTNP